MAGKAIEARANAATPGPWRPEADGGYNSAEARIVADAEYVASSRRARSKPAVRCCPACSDAAFIAAARTDVPALVARVRELEARASLPVIATCGECGSREDHLRETLCDHPESPHRWRVSMYRGTGTPPPDWCPLRRGAR